MRKSISIILASISIIVLAGCGVLNNTKTKENQAIKQSHADNESASESETQVNIDLTKENKTISVKSETDICKALTDAVTSRSSIINFDISNYNNINNGNLDIYKDTASVINNNLNKLIHVHTDLNIIERIEPVCDKEKKLITVRI